MFSGGLKLGSITSQLPTATRLPVTLDDTAGQARRHGIGGGFMPELLHITKIAAPSSVKSKLSLIGLVDAAT